MPPDLKASQRQFLRTCNLQVFQTFQVPPKPTVPFPSSTRTGTLRTP
jgi:hypothetical protein